VQIMLSGPTYARNPAAMLKYWRDLLVSVRGMPEVQVAGLANWIPLEAGGSSFVEVAGKSIPGAFAGYRVAGDGYFAALRIPVVAGRTFDPADAASPTVVISEGLARRFWPGEPAIGKALSLADSAVPATVIGVVRDASNAALWREKELGIYVPVSAATDPRDLQFIVRADGDASAIGRLLTQRAAVIAGDLRFTALPLDDLLRLWKLPSKVAAAGLGVLAVMALVMATVGLYGVLTFAVGERSRELGIRMALGADAAAVIRLILRDAWRLVLVGLAIGVACALPAAPILGKLLYGVSPFDPRTLAAAASFLTAVALIAAYRPARRASRLEPLAVLRVE